MHSKLRLRIAGLLFLLLSCGGVGCGTTDSQGMLISSQRQDGEAKVVTAVPGMIAPNFSLLDYEGKRHDLAEYRGKLLLLNFWASWCGPCRQELPDLAVASSALQDRLQVVGINLAEQDVASVSRELLQRNHIAYPNLLDHEGKTADAYGILVIPTSFLLDRNGKVLQKIQGPLTQKQLEQLVQTWST